MAAVVGADPEKPSQHVGDVAAEHAPVRVELVDDDNLELLEQLEPLGVVGQDRRMEHVRVRDDDLACGPDRRADGGRRVAVVGRGEDRHARGGRQPAEFGHLVLAERLGREQEERPRRRVVRDGLQDRHGVAQRLARGGRRDDDHVLARVDRLDRLGLVAVGPLDAARRESGDDPRVQPRREFAEVGRPRRDDRVVDDAPRHRWLGQDLGEDGLGVGGGVGAHSMASDSTDVRFPASLQQPPAWV